jgi:hypothetical protein
VNEYLKEEENMDPITQVFLLSLELRELQQYKSYAAIPLFSKWIPHLTFLTLSEALQQNLVQVTEVSSGGSVPNLKIINSGEAFVLLLDGEELVGAKQNRILNTTILIKGKSETLIPVSCCERGRWQYASKTFAASDSIMPSQLRQKKLGYVNNSLKQSRQYLSQQGDVWNDIRKLSQRAGVNSQTEAMRDVFAARANELEEYLKAFAWQPGQKGVLFFLNGEILGLDILPLESAYKVIHPKLVRSYTLDVVSAPTREKPAVEKARAFINEALKCKETQYSSVGCGVDCRFENTSILGSALIYESELLHAAFFPDDRRSQSAEGMAGYRERFKHRQRGDIIN